MVIFTLIFDTPITTHAYLFPDKDLLSTQLHYPELCLLFIYTTLSTHEYQATLHVGKLA
jgi:hypothetical protein